MRISKLIFLIFSLIVAQGAAAFEFPRIKGADAEYLQDARLGDAYAAQIYVLPLLDGRIMSDAESDALMGWLEWTFDALERAGDSTNAAWIASAAANHLWPRNENHRALGWASECIERVGEATERYPRIIAAYCYENASIVAGQMERGEEAVT